MKERKIDDSLLLEMFKSGKLQREIAEHFKCSPVAVSKRLKRLLPPPESVLDKYDLTPQQKQFVIQKAQGKSNTEAALVSYETGSRESAKVIGSQLMAKPEIQMSITDLMDYCGIDKPYRIRRLKNIIDCRDLNIAHKGLDMSFKLDGSYAAEKHLHGVVPIDEILRDVHRNIFGNNEETQN